MLKTRKTYLLMWGVSTDVGMPSSICWPSYARAFVNNTITVEQLGRSMRLGNLGEQIVLKSERAFKSIRFAGFERAPQALYGPLAKERDVAARTRNRELLADNPFEGIRIVDIIREGMMGDDPRLQ